jgi:hypothetical protein
MEKDKIQKYIKDLGNKAAAHLIFHELGLFNSPLLVFSPDFSAKKIKQDILKSKMNVNRLAVRFSYKNNINMPRGFFTSLQNALKFIEKERGKHKKASIIVHDIITPSYSYELYWDDNNFYIQLLPGIWEMDNPNPPDIILQNNKETVLHTYSETRYCKYINDECGFADHVIPPMPMRDLESKYRKINKLKNKVKILKSFFNPLFCHFIENSNGNLFFINARQTSSFDLSKIGYNNPKIFHKISSVNDIELWDGQKPILFEMTCSRGNDTSFIKAVEILSGSIRELYVNYGILSHPAIILREQGIDVKQVYNIYKTKILHPKNTNFK